MLEVKLSALPCTMASCRQLPRGRGCFFGLCQEQQNWIEVRFVRPCRRWTEKQNAVPVVHGSALCACSSIPQVSYFGICCALGVRSLGSRMHSSRVLLCVLFPAWRLPSPFITYLRALRWLSLSTSLPVSLGG